MIKLGALPPKRTGERFFEIRFYPSPAGSLTRGHRGKSYAARERRIHVRNWHAGRRSLSRAQPATDRVAIHRRKVNGRAKSVLPLRVRAEILPPLPPPLHRTVASRPRRFFSLFSFFLHRRSILYDTRYIPSPFDRRATGATKYGTERNIDERFIRGV